MPRLRERDQLEMAIDLPQILDVADLARIAVVEALAEDERRGKPGLGTDVPARREAEARIGQCEHVERAGEDAVRGRDVLRRSELLRECRQPRRATLPDRVGCARQAQSPALGAGADRAT